MPHLLLVVEPIGQRAERGVEGGKIAYARMLEYTEELQAAGVLMASSALAEHSRRLQVRDRQPRVIDGPYAEAKEMVGGFFLLNCERLEDALRWAERCPAAAFCSIEVRETGPCYT